MPIGIAGRGPFPTLSRRWFRRLRGACDSRYSTLSGGFTAKQVYANTDMSNHHGGVIHLGDYVYATSGAPLICMEIKTGKVMWSEPSVGKGSLAYADGRLYLRSEQGPVALIEASPDGLKELSRFDQPDRSGARSWPHPVIANGKLYLRDQDLLLCYDVKAK